MLSDKFESSPVRTSIIQICSSPYFINNFFRSYQILSFSFVRHPFERLVSAYNDKFKRGRKKIKDRYAKEWFKEEVSFSSFVDLILYEDGLTRFVKIILKHIGYLLFWGALIAILSMILLVDWKPGTMVWNI